MSNREKLSTGSQNGKEPEQAPQGQKGKTQATAGKAPCKRMGKRGWQGRDRKPSCSKQVSVDTVWDGCSSEHHSSHPERVKGG